MLILILSMQPFQQIAVLINYTREFTVPESRYEYK